MKTIRNIITYIPCRLHIAWTLLFFVPKIASADPNTSGDIFDYLKSLTNWWQEAKTYGLAIIIFIAGLFFAIWGIIMYIYIHHASDYRGKHTKASCFWIAIVSIVVVAISIYYMRTQYLTGNGHTIASSSNGSFHGL